MEEIEAKFKIEDVDLIRKKIIALGAALHSKKHQVDIYFNHSKSKELENVPSYLRIRTVDGLSKIAMHYKKEAYRWEEIEFSIEDGDKMKKLFKNLGFDIDVEVDKIRETFNLENAEIVIDEVKHVGYFLEVEAKSKEILFKYCTLLGFRYGNNDPLEGKSYADLVREARNKN